MRYIYWLCSTTLNSTTHPRRAYLWRLIPRDIYPRANFGDFSLGTYPRGTTSGNLLVSGLSNLASLHYTLHTTHYTTHYTTLHYTTLHYTTLHYTTLHYTTLHYTTLHYTTLHYTTLHYTTLHYTTLHYTTLQCLF